MNLPRQTRATPVDRTAAQPREAIRSCRAPCPTPSAFRSPRIACPWSLRWLPSLSAYRLSPFSPPTSC